MLCFRKCDELPRYYPIYYVPRFMSSFFPCCFVFDRFLSGGGESNVGSDNKANNHQDQHLQIVNLSDVRISMIQERKLG